MVLPIFKSHYSDGKSVLTLEKEESIASNKPVSIYAIAKKHGLKNVVLVDENFSGFFDGYEAFKGSEINFSFGLSINVLDDAKDQSAESCDRESKLWIIAKNTYGYYDLIALFNSFSTDKEKFYYHTRASFSDIFDNLTKNLLLVIPPFDSFIHKNVFGWSNCLPDIVKYNPLVCYSNMDLFWGDELRDSLVSFAKANDLQTQEVHPVYYYDKSYFKSWQTLRCIKERRALNKPELDGCISTNFSFEAFLQKCTTQNS